MEEIALFVLPLIPDEDEDEQTRPLSVQSVVRSLSPSSRGVQRKKLFAVCGMPGFGKTRFISELVGRHCENGTSQINETEVRLGPSQRERKALLERLSKTVAKLEQTKVDTETLHQQATSDANNADSSRANKYKRSTYLRSMSYDDYGGWDIDAPIRETRSPRGPTDAPPPPPKPTMIRMNPKSKNLHQAFAIREENQRRQRAYERQLDAYYGA
ncbi:hypothetical protein KCU64_g15138, partial [Aureobasidium melanogenum]